MTPQIPPPDLRNISLKRRTLFIEAQNPPAKAQTMRSRSVTPGGEVNPAIHHENRKPAHQRNQCFQPFTSLILRFSAKNRTGSYRVTNSNHSTYQENQREIGRLKFSAVRLYRCHNHLIINGFQARFFPGTAAVSQYRCCNYIKTNAL